MARPTFAPRSPAQQPRVQAAAAQIHSQQASEGSIKVSELPAAPLRPFMSAVGCLFIAIAGIFGYANQRDMALMATSGVRQTLTDTKSTFLEMADTIVPTMVNNPLQELLAQHHLIRFNSKYEYDVVFALGIKTVLNQLLEGLGETQSAKIQAAYFGALGDDVAEFTADASALETWASTTGKATGLDMSSDDETMNKLKGIAGRIADGKFLYTKFFSIGLFQVLQQSGQTDPENFTSLVSGMNLDKERVTKDLKVYKDLLKRLEMAKDMQKEFIKREKKKAEERAAAKAAKA